MKLNDPNTLFIIIVMSTLFTACQKEVDFQDITNNPPPGGGTTNNSIIGTWNFVGMVASTSSSVVAGTGPAEEKAISSYGFISQNNVGTVTINATTVTSAGVGYSIDTVVTTEFYLGGVLIDTFHTDFAFDMPLSSAVAPYTAVGSDSIYFSSGFLTLGPSAGVTPTTAAGSKISWSGDTLLLKTVIVENRTESVNGVAATIANNISQVVKLKK
jgi:hypothetical protein